ncbi:hypothetical protein NR218_07870 [Staphylococcus sp. SUC_1.2]|uniref:hypothetical protein n=1 Tax=Staphylococcus sp. SUC_1.2 TaxID=2969256 RepID=UPI0022463458|nr:hypothetical protein [Staphylococcus sp. SUC_1.2]MCW9140954.1 hypothetical protein [Staphylococcus sp. SUC_1.2]
MISFKDQTKISWNESKYKKSLDKDELKIFKSLSRKEKDYLILFYINEEPVDLSESDAIEILRDRISKIEFEDKQLKRDEEIEASNKKIENNKENEQKKDEKLIRFFKTQGINEPTSTTKNAFDKQSIFANFDNFYHALGTFTFNMEKQATYNYYMSQQKQNFVQIAQLDTLIKQHNDLLNQNHKVMQQNDEIIELLRQIANK